MNDLIAVSRKIYGVDPLKVSRSRMYVWARAAVMVELHKNNITLADIGSVFDKNHATVIHALKQHKNLIQDTEYLSYYQRFLREIGSETEITTVLKKDKINAAMHNIKIVDFTNHQTLIDLVKDVPEESIESVFIKLQAIVRMSKVRHLIK